MYVVSWSDALYWIENSVCIGGVLGESSGCNSHMNMTRFSALITYNLQNTTFINMSTEFVV